MRRLLILSALLLCCSFVTAQQYITTIKELESKDGLNGNIKFQSLIDRNGFLWLSSAYGLDRYDGQEVLNFSIPQNDISKSQILKIWEANDGIIWVLSGFAIQTNSKNDSNSSKEVILGQLQIDLVNPINGNLLKNEGYFSDLDFRIMEHFTSFEVVNEDLIFATKDGDLIHFKDGFKKVTSNKTQNVSFYNWTIDKLGNTYFILDNTISIVKNEKIIQSRTVQKDTTLFKLHWTENFGLEILCKIRPNQFLGFILDKDLNLSKQYKCGYAAFPFKEKFNKEIDFIKDKTNFYLENQKGEQVFNLEKFQKDNFKPILWSWSDRKSDIIVAQSLTNLLLIKQKTSPFENYLNDKKTSFSTRGITASTDQKVFVNLGKEFIIIDKKTNNFIKKTTSKTPDDFVVSTKCIFDNTTQNFWSINSMGVFRVNSDGDSFVNYPIPPNIVTTGLIRLEKNKEMISFGSHGVQTLNNECSCFRQRTFLGEQDKIDTANILKINETANGALFYSDKEIFSWNAKTNFVETIQSYPSEISSNHILEVYPRNQQEIWFATTTNGIYQWLIEENVINKVGRDEGLSNDVVYSIIEDEFGYFWLPTTYGLNRYHPEKKTNSIYLTEDGLPHNEFNTYSHHQDKNGRIYLGGLNGITSFHPSSFLYAPRIGENQCIISAVQKKDLDSENVQNFYDFNKTIEFRQGKELLEINFAAPNLANTSPIRYQYRFDEQGDNWINHYSNKLSFSSLIPGNYTLRIRGPGSNLTWSTKEAILKIKVPTPFFESFLFYFLAFAITVGISYLYFRWRTYNLQRSRQLLKEEVYNRTKSLRISKEKIEEQATELSKLGKIKSIFFTNVSHELRTPLTMVINPLKELKEKNVDDDTAEQYIDSAYFASHQLRSIIDRILKIAELDDGTIAIDQKSLSLKDIYQHFILPMEQSALDLDIQFNTEQVDQSSTLLLLDIEKVREIFSSIIQNAISHSNSGDIITLSLKYQQGNLNFSCKDKGPGITEKEQLKIFERYHQGNVSGYENQGGLGIGLTLSKAFANLMKGDLTVKSKFGEGALFSLFIPCTTTEIASNYIEEKLKAETLASSNNQIAPPLLPPSTILIVEDHKLMNFFLSSSLGKEYHIITAKNGKEALAILDKRAQEIDLILSDWMMPLMDGPTFLGKIRGKLHARHIPVIMLSARAARRDQLSALRIGIDDYLTKPFDNELLKARISNLIDNYRVRKNELDFQRKEGLIPLIEDSSADEKWLSQLKAHIAANFSSPSYGPTFMAEAMNLSERQLSRKSAALVGISPSNYLREFRLLQAENFLKNQTYLTVAEVSHACGYSNPDYFSKIFKKRFGITPSVLLRNKN